MRALSMLLGILSGLLGLILAVAIGAYGYMIGTVENASAGDSSQVITSMKAATATSEVTVLADTASEASLASNPKKRSEVSIASASSSSRQVSPRSLNEDQLNVADLLIKQLGMPDNEAFALADAVTDEELSILLKFLTQGENREGAMNVMVKYQEVTAQASQGQSEAETDADYAEAITPAMFLAALQTGDLSKFEGILSDEELEQLKALVEGDYSMLEGEFTPEELNKLKKIQSAGVGAIIVQSAASQIDIPGAEPLFTWLAKLIGVLQGKDAVQLMTTAVILAIVSLIGLVGATLAKARPIVAAIMMLIAAVGGYIVISTGFIISAPLFILAALFAFLGRKKAKKKVAPSIRVSESEALSEPIA